MAPLSPPAAFYEAWELIDFRAVQVSHSPVTAPSHSQQGCCSFGWQEGHLVFWLSHPSSCSPVCPQWWIVPRLFPTWVALTLVVAFSSSLDVAAIETEARQHTMTVHIGHSTAP